MLHDLCIVHTTVLVQSTPRSRVRVTPVSAVNQISLTEYCLFQIAARGAGVGEAAGASAPIALNEEQQCGMGMALELL